jgi:hypothetical protein
MEKEDNIVVLKSVYGKTSGQDFHILPCIDPVTGDYPDCVRPSIINPDGTIGQMILSEKDLNDRTKGKVFIPAEIPIIVKHNETFNLNKPVDAAKWEAIKNSKLIAKERFQKDSNGNYVIDGEKAFQTENGMVKGHYGLADLYIDRPGVVAKVRNDLRALKAKAINLIADDSLDGMIKKCRLLEKDMSHANSNDVMDYLMTFAERDPQKIINLYTGTDTANRLLVIDAIEKHIVVKRDNLLVYADNIVLGASVDAAVTYLMSPNAIKIKELIMQETYPELYTKKEKKSKED